MSETENQSKNEIIMCMGSACFTRGNNRNVELVKDYLKNHSLDACVKFRGCLCTNRCRYAPVIIINGQVFEKIVPEAVNEILDHCFKRQEDKNESA